MDWSNVNEAYSAFIKKIGSTYNKWCPIEKKIKLKYENNPSISNGIQKNIH